MFVPTAFSKSLSVITHTLIELVDSSCYFPAIKCTGFKYWSCGLEVHVAAIHYHRSLW